MRHQSCRKPSFGGNNFHLSVVVAILKRSSLMASVMEVFSKNQAITCFIFVFGLSLAPLAASYDRQRLLTTLLVNYNTLERPGPATKPVLVSMKLELQNFNFRESDGALHLLGLLDFSWHDPKLTWNPQEFGNITATTVNQRAIWVPDIELYNNAPEKFIRTHRNGVVMVRHDGTCIWVDNVDLSTFCNTNMVVWPHDHHECILRFGSWTFDGNAIDIVDKSNRSVVMDMNDISIEKQNNIYRIIKFEPVWTSLYYECCVEPYVSVDYHITFARRSSFVCIFYAPAIAVVVLTLLAMGLEPGCTEKILLNGTSVLIIIMNLLYFAKKLGKVSRSTPLIVLYFSCSLVLVSFAHLVNVFALLATRSRYRGKLPQCISTFLKSSWANSIYCTSKTHTNLDHEHIEGNSQFEDVKLQESSNLIGPAGFQNEWLQLAIVTERSALIILSVLFILLGTYCFL